MDFLAADELESVFEQMVQERVDGLVVDHTPIATQIQERVSHLVARHRLPAIADGVAYSEGGFLLSYSVDMIELMRKAAGYVDKILKGAKPAELPVELASKFNLIVNLRTAKTLGIKLPQAILLAAHLIIE